ncbi:DUF7507 domain-containing protein [Macrococcus armenti]|uniref:DUF7507 domain-containing protein n=1 Tax=Macrococcus armenti TaxID=2875764 RepID=UPI0024084846|nr:SpaA isopeptide-forming pilin-related protein [Macrococcus armenti]
MKNRKIFSYLLLIIMILSMFDGLMTHKSKAATSGTPPAVCQATMTGTTTIPKVTLTPKPLDLVFILDASGSFTSNMPKVKSMINSAIDKYVQPADGDRTMVTTFQGVKDNIYQAPVGTNYYAYTEGNYKITTNSSKLTSDITSVKNFVNSVTPGGGTPTPSGVTQALNDYKSVAGTATDRQTVFVLITDGVANVNPKTQNLEKNATLEQAYIDKFKSVSTFVGQYYDSYVGQYYNQYRWARYDAVTGAFVRYEYINDYPSTANDTFYNAATQSWENIYLYETSQDWKARLNDLTAAVTNVKTTYPNAEMVVGFLENRSTFSNMDQYGPLYESTMRPQIQTALKSYVTDPSYYINTGDANAFVSSLSAAISNAVSSVSSTGSFTLTDGYKLESLALVNKTTGQRIPLNYTQNGTAISVSAFDYDGADYSLEYTTSLSDPSKLIIDATPTVDEYGPSLSGTLTIGSTNTTIPKFSPSAGDVYKYLNCQAKVSKSVKKATESVYSNTQTTLDYSTQTFTFSNLYTFGKSPLGWTNSPILYDKIDPRLDILDVKVVATDSTGTVSTPFILGNAAVTTANNEVKITLPKDANGTFTSYIDDKYQVFITAKIKPEYANGAALYTDIVTNGIPNQAELLTYVPNTNILESQLSNEVKVYAPSQAPVKISFQKNGILPDSSAKGLEGATFTLTSVTDYIDAQGKVTQVTSGAPITLTSASLGKVISPNIMPGKYLLKETAAPDGYKLDSTEYILTVNTDGTFSVLNKSTNQTATTPFVVNNTQLKTGIDLVKTSNVSSVTKAGDVITYTFKVTNTGEVPLDNTTLKDPMFSEGITLSKTTIAPGETVTGTAQHTVTQSEINGGDIVNTAIVSAIPPGDLPVPTDKDSVTVTTPDLPEIKLVKTTASTNVKEGEVVTYNFEVINTGNVTLNNVILTDPKLGGAITLKNNTLQPGQTTTGTATYTVQPEDMRSINIINTATVSGTSPTGQEVKSTDDATVVPMMTPAITLDKTTDTKLVRMPGQSIEYNFIIKNTGDVTLSNITLDDPMISDVQLQKTTLAPGESTVATGKHIVTQEEFDSGNIKNKATVKGTPPVGTPVNSSDSVDVPTELMPSIKLEKTTKSVSVKQGEVVTYNFTVTNTGNTTLSNVVVNDPMLGGSLKLDKTTLAPNETTTGVATYTVTATDMANDQIENIATVTGIDPKSQEVKDTDNAITTPDGKPGINLDKSTETTSVSNVGDVITYNFTVTNTGDTTLTNVKVNDPMFSSVTLEKTTLQPGESTTAIAKYTVTQKDIDSGQIVNDATATGTPPSGTPPKSDDSVTVPAIATTAIELVKQADKTEISQHGEVITYLFTVKNTGTTTLTDVVVNDPLIPDDITLEKTTLLPGESTIGRAQYTVTQDDINRGNVFNTAVATGNPVAALDPPMDRDNVNIPVVINNGIQIEKTSATTSITAPGQEIVYEFKVTNTGNTTLTTVRIDDPMFPTGGILTTRTINPGESTTSQATHIVTQEEFDSGQLVNIATVTGEPPFGEPPTDNDTVTIDSERNTSISLEKTANQQIVTEVGESILYTFVVKNTGNTTLTDVNVSDPMFKDGIVLNKTTLLPGESTIGTAIKVVTQDEINKEVINNTATVTGTPPEGLVPPEDTSTATVKVEQNPELTLNKTANIDLVQAAGESIVYNIEIYNTGNVTLSNIKLDDPMFGGAIELSNTTLNPGEMTSVQLEHKVTQEEFDSGKITNTATVEGTPPTGTEVTNKDTEVVYSNPEASISLDKSSDVTEVSKAGDIVNYTFKITNTGNSTLTNIKLSDEMLGGIIDLPDTVLLPGQSTTVTKQYIVKQSDIDKLKIVNTATVIATPPDGVNPPTATDDNVVKVNTSPDISIEKLASKDNYTLGDTITYTFKVTNTGNVTLNDVEAIDLSLEKTIKLDKTTLAPGESTIATFDYIVTQQDMDRGMINNVATAEGTPPDDLTPPTDRDEVTVNADQQTSITLDKSTQATGLKAGDTVTYDFTVKNTGTVTLKEIVINDPMFQSVTIEKTMLSPGESTTGKATHTVTQEEVDAGKLTNIATVTGTPPAGLEPPTAKDTVEITQKGSANITLDKSTTSTLVNVGDTVTYDFTVTNTGTVTLKDIKLDDPMFKDGVTLEKTTLAPGESTTGKATHVVTQEEVDAGKLTNTATVTGTPPSGLEPPISEDKVEIPANAQTSITLDKSTQATGLKAGETVTYDFTVTNTGTVTLKDVKLTDPMFKDGVTLVKTTLAPGESTTGKATHTVTQEEVDAGKLTNTAKVKGTPPGDLTPPTAEDTVEITQEGSANIALEKIADKAILNVGEEVTYTFKVTNTGTVTLKDIIITDPMLKDSITLDKTTLAPGESATGQAKHVVTQEEIDAGKLTNTASVTGMPPGDLTPPTSEDSVEIPANAQTSITLDKSTQATGLKAGETVTYDFTVTNTGTVTLKDVVITDPMFQSVTLDKTTLAPGESATGQATHVITQQEVDTGKLTNTATVIGMPPIGLEPPTAQDSVEITQEGSANITLEKVADKTLLNVGDNVTYTFKVTNTGTVTLKDIKLDDPMFKDGVTLEKTTLAPGESTTGKATHVVTQDEIDAGKLTNTATVTGTPPGDITPPSSEDKVEIPTDAKTSITLDKSTQATGLKAGETVTYDFTVTNTGTVTLKDVKLDDQMFKNGVTLEKTTLAPGESTTGKATHVVTQEEVDDGKLSNTATVTGTPPSGFEPPTAEDSVEITQEGSTNIDLEKTADKAILNVGDEVTYTFKVTNTGTVTLKDVVITDPMFKDGVTLEKTTLAPGESTTGKATHVITQDEIDAGKHTNTATVTGAPPGNLTPPTATDSVEIPTNVKTSISLDKSTQTTELKVGDTITYNFTVTNTGTVTLKDVKLTDPMFKDGVMLEKTTLAPGESTTGQATHVVTQEEVDSGKLTNTAIVIGTPPDGMTPPTAEDKVEITQEGTANISLEKIADKTTINAGDEVTYTFKVTNTGTVTLKDVVITDPMFKEGVTLEKTTLAPGESTTGHATHVVTQEEVDAGILTNTATVTGTPPGDLTPPTAEDTVDIPTNAATSITLDKSTNATTLKVGDEVTYDFKVTNTGTVTLKDVKLTDPMFKDGVTLDKTTLAPGESTTGHATHVVTQEEVDAGILTNTATVTGTPPGDLTPPTAEDTVEVTQEGTTNIALEKSADKASVKVGDEVTYDFKVTNTGTVTLKDVTLTDPMFKDGVTLDKTTLAPGESTTGHATHVVTQEEVDAGILTNTATVTGTPPGDLTPPTAEDTVDIPTNAATSITLDKSTNATTLKVGDEVTYDFKVTNTGTVTLKDVKLTDPMFKDGVTLDKTTLAPGESTTGHATHVVTQEEVDSGKLTNTATVTGTPPGGITPPTAEDTVEVTQEGTTNIALEKSADKASVKVGDEVTYDFKVTNTGTVTLKDVTLTDPMFKDGVTLDKTTLAPGESTTGHATHVVTQEEVDAGILTNTATVTGTPPGDLTPPTAEDTVDIPTNAATSITLDKSTNATTLKVGDEVTYDFKVTNTGTVTLKDVKLTDPMFKDGVTLDKTTLAPGESTTGHATHVVTQEEVDSGKLTNTATVTGTPPGGMTPPTAEDTVEVTQEGTTNIALEKSADKASVKVGDEVTYDFKVTNTGTVTLKDVKLTDPMFKDGVTLDKTTLAPGESTTGHATHVVTQEEVDAGILTNTATVTGTPPGDLTLPTAEDTVDIPTIKEPSTEEPSTEAPSTEEPSTEEPSTEEPSTEEPSTEEPSTEEPSTEEPSTEEPSTEEPSTEEPSTEEPSTEEPSTEEPSTEEPSTEESSTEEPSTEEPSTEAPSTEAPSTEAPSTEEPSTEAPSTEAPSTEEPSTEEPSTEAPSTEEPSTEEPSTEEPSTEEPSTEEPSTEAPSTEAPSTEAPSTEAPSTEAPSTEAPSTEAPSTEVPSTEAPSTEAPSTEVPSTEAPSTEVPSTEKPSVGVPEKDVPTTEGPVKQQTKESQMPDTGEIILNYGFYGTILFGLGSLLIIRSRRRD